MHSLQINDFLSAIKNFDPKKAIFEGWAVLEAGTTFGTNLRKPNIKAVTEFGRSHKFAVL